MKHLIFSLAFLLVLTGAMAHGGKKHKKDSTKKTMDSTMNMGEKKQHVEGDTVHHHDEGMAVDESKVTADFDDFPTLHPLIVHFAIVLIIVAAAMQLLNIYFMKKEISWIVTAILLAGVAAAWFAAKNFHPHTHGISEHAQQVLDQHDKWADWTINSGFVALLLQVANLFLFKDKRWAGAVVAAVLALSAYSVSRAGHYGSQLVHIEGIGPQGKYLEMEHHHEH
ncbi:MAG: Membrane protein [Cytophagales bacterium]|jgi:uncharacterized membrane protein|nr:hypothetical protein [Bacteroidota bacterium]MBS1950767.1 hypothetical protein [Bacteroidota bacterium]MBS1980674.1 hypothetical protein [Bacteroidota bacterium]WHZ08003.1 MAG: Membrane protein [Cytophagales bacterium]